MEQFTENVARELNTILDTFGEPDEIMAFTRGIMAGMIAAFLAAGVHPSSAAKDACECINSVFGGR